jgi:sugar lactone lactonase YvrE
VKRRAVLAALATVASGLTLTVAGLAPSGAAAERAGGPAADRAVAGERERWDTRVLTRVPRPGYPAFAYAHPNGRVYAGTFTNPAGDEIPSKIFEWTRSGTLLRSWTVPGQDLAGDQGAQAAVSDSRGRLIVLERSTARVMRLSLETGRFSRYSRIPDLPTCSPGSEPDGTCSPNQVDGSPIPNFAAWGRKGVLYVTDYGQAVIWRIPPGGGQAQPWFADARLDGGQFNTSGLLMAPDRKALLVAQQTSALTPQATQGSLFRLPIRASGAPGRLRTLWTSLPGDLPDGFGIGRSGRIYLANAGLSQQLVVLSPAGEELERFPEVPGTGENGSPVPFDTPSSATFVGKRVLVANQSFFGNRDHHAVLDVHVGERGEPVWIPRRAGR